MLLEELNLVDVIKKTNAQNTTPHTETQGAARNPRNTMLGE